MGRVRTATVKRASRAIIEKHYTRMCTDFQLNKRIVSDVAQIPSKRLRNKIAGYVTSLVKRIQKGPVRGISVKLQEEERERRDNYVPSVSSLTPLTPISVDATVYSMLKKMNFGQLSSIDIPASETEAAF